MEKYDVWDKAINNAEEAFYKTFEDAGLDGISWSIEIISHMMDYNYTDVLETKIYNNLGRYHMQRFQGRLKKNE